MVVCFLFLGDPYSIIPCCLTNELALSEAPLLVFVQRKRTAVLRRGAIEQHDMSSGRLMGLVQKACYHAAHGVRHGSIDPAGHAALPDLLRC